MSLELFMKTEYGDGDAFYAWRFSPVKNDKEGWVKIAEIAEALGKLGREVEVSIDGPYAGEKEYGDIGWKGERTPKQIMEMLDELVRDENYEGYMIVGDGDNRVKVRYQIIAGNRVELFVSGNKKDALRVSGVIKKVLGE